MGADNVFFQYASRGLHSGWVFPPDIWVLIRRSVSVAAAFTEDRFGIVQFTLPVIIVDAARGS